MDCLTCIGCLVKYSHLTTRPEDVVYACPCSNGLHCHGDGVNEVPLGERGNQSRSYFHLSPPLIIYL